MLWFEKHLRRHFPGAAIQATRGRLFDLPPFAGSSSLTLDDLDHWRAIPGRPVEAVSKIVSSARQVILATDPDDEGDLIASHVAAMTPAGVPVYRLRIRALTPQELEHAISAMSTWRDSANAAIARRCFDYTIGLAGGLPSGGSLPVSRVIGHALGLLDDFQLPQYRIAGDCGGGFTVPFASSGLHAAQKAPVENSGPRAQPPIEEPVYLNTEALLVEGAYALDESPHHVYKAAQELYEEGQITYIRTSSTASGAGGESGAVRLAQAFGLPAVSEASFGAITGPHSAILPTPSVDAERVAQPKSLNDRVLQLVCIRTLSELFRCNYAQSVEVVPIREFGVAFMAERTQLIDEGRRGKTIPTLPGLAVPSAILKHIDYSLPPARILPVNRVAEWVSFLAHNNVCPPGELLSNALRLNAITSPEGRLNARGLRIKDAVAHLSEKLISPRVAMDLKAIFSDEGQDIVARLDRALASVGCENILAPTPTPDSPAPPTKESLDDAITVEPPVEYRPLSRRETSAPSR